MKYWIINTDQASFEDSDIRICDFWYKHQMAFAGDYKGNEGKHRRFFEKVSEADFVFMYQSGKGIVGFGRIAEPWDGNTYTENERLLYINEAYEYRIRVEWDPNYDRRDNPLKGKEYLPYRGYYAYIDPNKWNISRVLKLLKR